MRISGCLGLTGIRHKIRGHGKTATVICSPRTDSEPDSDTKLHFLASPFRQYQHDRKTQARLEELGTVRQKQTITNTTRTDKC